MSKRIHAFALVAAVLAVGCNETTSQSTSTSSTTSSTTATGVVPGGAAAGDASAGGKMHKLASGLQYEDVMIGSGKMAEPGMNVSVHYSGWLTDGTPFDSSRKPGGQPLQFQLGAGRVIQGWEEGIKGMRIGGKRKLTIPPDLAYGASGYGGGVIPPNATLLFDIELLDVK